MVKVRGRDLRPDPTARVSDISRASGEIKGSLEEQVATLRGLLEQQAQAMAQMQSIISDMQAELSKPPAQKPAPNYDFTVERGDDGKIISVAAKPKGS